MILNLLHFKFLCANIYAQDPDNLEYICCVAELVFYYFIYVFLLSSASDAKDTGMFITVSEAIYLNYCKHATCYMMSLQCLELFCLSMTFYLAISFGNGLNRNLRTFC